MSDCVDFRRSLLSDPHALDAAQRLHRSNCPDCARYFDDSQSFENRLERALRIPLGSPAVTEIARLGRPIGTRPRPERRRRRWLAAAGILLSASVGGGLWIVAPARSLAAAVVLHMAEEPDAWAKTDHAVPSADLDSILNRAHVRLKPSAGLVSYANGCTLRGHYTPHLVFQSIDGPVTVMLLPDETVRTRTRFDENGYRGVLVPVPGHGALAVLERGHQMDGAEVDGIAAKVVSAFEWNA